jgi:hypothetical protein
MHGNKLEPFDFKAKKYVVRQQSENNTMLFFYKKIFQPNIFDSIWKGR